ncbi:hypothetical protein [Nocardia veterana]|uniref:Uncharacterized protein n=1 Tax=Nocardia veterana TaxID=132249 RepID=A0A7X6LZP8_9NOCA|nr:hypothetical protein [Nocardia veterana]NKY87521.1 hypothetical protein [Nocardia veterana]
MTETGTVQVSAHQFLLAGSGTDTTAVTAEGTLIWTGPGFVTIVTGIAYGTATLTVDTNGTTTALDEWETVEETVIESPEDLQVLSVDGVVAEGYAPIRAGRYRVRAHARGRDLDFDGVATEPTEQYLLLITPTTRPTGSITRLRKTDAAHEPPAKQLPQVDYEHFYAPGPDGNLTKFTIDSPEAQAVFALRNRWGGRRPSGRIAEDLTISTAASIIADLDRDLVDEIDSLSDDRLRALARWCARRAFERSGLIEFDDFRTALDAMDDGTTPPPDFANDSLAIHRLQTDPAIPLTIEPGIAGATDFVPQYEAARTYMLAVNDDIVAIRAALEAVRSAIATHGRNYPEFIDRLRSEFLHHNPA